MTPELSGLITDAKHGDAEAFGRLYGYIYQDLYHYALYRLGSCEEAEDAVQETALEAFRGIGNLKNVDAFRSWMFTILSARCNRHIHILVQQRNQTPLEDCELPINDFAGETDISCHLREVIRALPKEDQQLVLLSVIGGFSGKEIAAIMNRPQGTLRSRLHRTLKKLRAVLDDEPSDYKNK